MKILISESQYKWLLNEQPYLRSAPPMPSDRLGPQGVMLSPKNVRVTAPVSKGLNPNYNFWDKVIDFFLPGTPVKDGRNLLSTFDEIIKRRIEYNKKTKLPLETLTPEERSFREKILKATPNYGYPDIIGLSKIIQDINNGKNIQPSEFQRYKKIGTQDNGKIGTQKYSDQKLKQMMSSRDELKRMWLGIDEPGGENKGYWVKSEFKPKTSTNPNAVYFKPKNIPKLTLQQFDELYNAILKTKLPNGNFPGGNSHILFDNKFQYLDNNKRDELRGDLGNFKFGVGDDGGKKYISLYDEWDLVPPSAKTFGVNVQKYGYTPLIYFRIYRP